MVKNKGKKADSYAVILGDLRVVVKQFAGLRKNVSRIRERIGKAKDQAEAARIRQKIKRIPRH